MGTNDVAGTTVDVDTCVPLPWQPERKQKASARPMAAVKFHCAAGLESWCGYKDRIKSNDVVLARKLQFECCILRIQEALSGTAGMLDGKAG